jgi:peptide/nickel transport system substrate-binding protein
MKNHLNNAIAKNLSELKNLPLIIVLVLFLASGCSDKSNRNDERIIIGIESDVQTINPMYAFSLFEGNLIDLLFMKPADEIWNDSLGIIEFKPMLAKQWEWNDDKSTLKLYLRENIFWSDGIPITSDDIVYTFDVYSNPESETRFLGQFENFYTLDGLQIDIEKTFKIISQTILEIHFRENSNPSLLDINLEIIPKHIWSKYKPDELPQAQGNFEPVTSGPFKLTKWDRESSISLRIDSTSFLFNPENIKEIIFKVIPDYKSRLTHLKTGAIDILDNIKSEDIEEVRSVDELNLVSLRGRDYDYIGWNHIEPGANQGSEKVPNKFFTPADIRKALTSAINRKEIIESYLGDFAELCKGPVSPMFKSYYDADLPAYDYNPQLAKDILKKNGWEDKDRNGIVEKNNVEFSFDLYISTGNPRRTYVSTVVKNNLKAIGIEANIQTLEMGAFVERLMSRDFDAWISGWTIPVPIELNPYWNSDPEVGFLNFSSYSNEVKDEILNSLQQQISEDEKVKLYKELQQIFYEDEPVTFLYWIDNIVAYNERISKINFSMLGLVSNAWEWRVD